MESQNQFHQYEPNSEDDFDPNDPHCITKFLDRELPKIRLKNNYAVSLQPVTKKSPSNDDFYQLEPVNQKSTQELSASSSVRLDRGLNGIVYTVYKKLFLDYQEELDSGISEDDEDNEEDDGAIENNRT